MGKLNMLSFATCSSSNRATTWVSETGEEYKWDQQKGRLTVSLFLKFGDPAHWFWL
jgi:hypothetical protein